MDEPGAISGSAALQELTVVLTLRRYIRSQVSMLPSLVVSQAKPPAIFTRPRRDPASRLTRSHARLTSLASARSTPTTAKKPLCSSEARHVGDAWDSP